MQFLKTLVVVVVICFSFALNVFGQKIALRETEIYVDENLYGFIEPISPSTQNYLISIGYLQSESSGIFSYLRKLPSYVIYSPNKSLIGYILPESGQIRPSSKTPLIYTVLFYSDIQPRSLQYPAMDTIKPIIQDIVSFELINNNTLDKSSLRRLFEKYGKEVKYTELKWRRNRKVGDCGTGSQYQKYNPDFPIWKIDGKANLISYDDNFIAKYDIISVEKDEWIKEANYFDQFNNFKAKVKLINIDEQENNIFGLEYKLFTNKQEERIVKIQIYHSPQTTPIQAQKQPLTTKMKIQLYKVGEYLQNNFYL